METIDPPMSQRCISAFGNLSTIRLIFCDSLASDPVWDEVKGLAIRQLKGSLVDGPKRLKTIVLVPGTRAWANV